MNDSTPATLAQSKVFTNKSYKSIVTKSKRNINSYVQNFTREFVMKRVLKDGEILLLSNVYKKYCRQLSVTAM